MDDESSAEDATEVLRVTEVEAAEAEPPRRRVPRSVLALSVTAGALAVAIAVTLTIVFWPRAASFDGAPMPVPSRTASATPSASPTPTPTPTAEGSPPPLSALVLTESGLGDLRLGVDPAVTAGPASIAVFRTLECGGYEESGWAANYTEQWPFGLAASAGEGLVGIQVRSSEITTDRGIRVGMSLDSVLAAYPEALPLSEGGYIHRYGFATDSGTWSVDVWMGDDQKYRQALSILITNVANVSELGRPSYHALGLSCV